MNRQNINDKVSVWVKENLGLTISELAQNDQRIRINADGTILINQKLLQDKGLYQPYLDFLESLKAK